VSYNYFDLLVETDRTSKMVGELLKKYMIVNHIPGNLTQIVILHCLMKSNKSLSPYEVQTYMKSIRTNNNYNYQCLIDNGYITQGNGKEIGIDNRCVFFDVTSKGKTLYWKILAFTNDKMREMSENLQWTEDNFKDYFADIFAMQESLK
jgi:hypothetical protein